MPARILNVAIAATVVGTLLATRAAHADADESYRAGVGLLDRGMLAEAVAELRAALDAKPVPRRRDEIRYALAVALLRMRKDGEAAEVLREIPLDARFEHAPEAILLRGRLVFDAGDHAWAAAVLATMSDHHASSPRLADAEWLRGEALLRAGRAAEARAVLAAAIERWPEHANRPRSTVLCAAAEIGLGDDAAAAARLGRLRTEPLDRTLLEPAALMEAQALHRLGRWEAALDPAAAALGPSDGDEVITPFAGDSPAAMLGRSALLRLGDAALASGDAATAERWLTRLRDGLPVGSADGSNSAAPEAHNEAPNEGANGGARERSAALLRLAIAIERQGRAAEALPIFAAVVELGEPEAHHAGLASATALASLARSDEARTVLTALADETRAAPIDLRVEALRRLAEMARDRGDAAELLAVESRLLALDGAAPKLRRRSALEVARLCLESNDALGALAALDAMNAIQAAAPSGSRGGSESSPTTTTTPPSLANLHTPLELRAAYLRGVALARLDRDADAAGALASIEALDRAAMKDESTAAIADAGLLLLGETRLASGDAPGAVTALQRLVDGDALDRLPPATASTALLRLGEACTAAQRWSSAEEAFLRHRTRFPQDSLWFQAAFGAGLARERQGRHDAAIESYRAVLERHDGVTAARARFHIGECLYALGRFDDAVREFLKTDLLHASSEWSAAALYEAGRCLVEQERFVDARAQFERVVGNDAAGDWASLARERLVEVERALRPEALPGGE